MEILLVDDDLAMLQTLRRMLCGHAVTQAPGGHSALAHITSGKTFDAIVCDLNMPAMRGGEFYAAVEALDPKQANRILFVTGGARTAADEAILVTHPSLMKPFTVEELEKALARFAPANAAHSASASASAARS
jgi:CheY-like chemotaxis protein